MYQVTGEGNAAGRYTDGDLSTPRTKIVSADLNRVWDELLALLSRTSLAPSSSDNGQLAQVLPLLARVGYVFSLDAEDGSTNSGRNDGVAYYGANGLYVQVKDVASCDGTNSLPSPASSQAAGVVLLTLAANAGVRAFQLAFYIKSGGGPGLAMRHNFDGSSNTTFQDWTSIL